MVQCVEIKLNPVAAAGTEGFSKFEDICLGGLTPEGLDATNELSYLILESTRALQINQGIRGWSPLESEGPPE
jgi:pyruvate-formate lyase